MNFFRGLTAAFIVAAMGAIVLAASCVACAGRAGVTGSVRRRAHPAPISRMFSAAYRARRLCLVVSLIALIRMEERPLRAKRGRSSAGSMITRAQSTRSFAVV